MATNLKLVNFKGIKEIVLKDIGHINVISGKNNSGKSSILESIAKYPKNICSLGITIGEDEIALLKELFSRMASGYSTPHPTQSIPWFNALVDQEKGKAYYNAEINAISQVYRSGIKKLGNYSSSAFDFDEMLKKLFDPNHNRRLVIFKPLLIPAKRRLDEFAEFDFDAIPQPDGKNLINRLFNLKNQDVNSRSHKTYLNIYNTFRHVTNGIFLNIVPNDKKLVIRFSENGESWLSADECGLGLQDVLVIMCNVIDSDATFVMIEEPENHIHPDMQRRLLQYLKIQTDKQFLLTTHSNVFLDSTLIDRMYFTSMTQTVAVTDETNRASVLRDLGYSVVDNLVSDLVILTEGPSDAPMIEEICKKLGFWNRFNIKIWPMGGDIMSQLDLSTFVDNIVRTKIIALIDSDPGSTKERNRFKANCETMGIKCTQLERYSIENYIPLSVLKKFTEFNIPEEITNIDPNIKLEEQIGVNVKKNMRRIAKEIALTEMENTDLLDFCSNIRKIVEQKDL